MDQTQEQQVIVSNLRGPRPNHKEPKGGRSPREKVLKKPRESRIAIIGAKGRAGIQRNDFWKEKTAPLFLGNSQGSNVRKKRTTLHEDQGPSSKIVTGKEGEKKRDTVGL